jgi:hypothetical protein
LVKQVRDLANTVSNCDREYTFAQPAPTRRVRLDMLRTWNATIGSGNGWNANLYLWQGFLSEAFVFAVPPPKGRAMILLR